MSARTELLAEEIEELRIQITEARRLGRDTWNLEETLELKTRLLVEATAALSQRHVLKG
jgi:hypothetical protein